MMRTKRVKSYLVVVGLFLGTQCWAGHAFAGEPTVKAAITAQIVNVDKNKPARIELTTLVSSPYLLKPAGLTVQATGIKLSSFKEKTSRRACKSTTCKQRFQIYLKATTACRLNGTYYAYFRFKCQTKSCTYKSNRRKKITFKLKSENFCANKTVNGTK